MAKVEHPIELADDRDPWDKQPGERSTPYYYFSLYRDMLPHERSIRKVAAIVGRSEGVLTRASWRYRWMTRVEAWDASLDADRREAARQAVIDMEARHAQMAALILSKVAQRLVGDPAGNIQAIDVNRLSASDIARLAEVATKVERIARGADREHEESRDGVKLKVAFDFTPQYPQELEEGVELPPSEYKELPEVATES